MPTKTLRFVALAASLLLIFIDPWAVGLDQHPGVRVHVEHNERIGRNEAHFRVSVTNSSRVPLFSTGIIYESGPRLYPLYLEQEKGPAGWHIVAPCVDTPPPQVIKLDPGVPMIQDLVLKVPLEGVCKERNLQIEGKFRFRVYYFETEAKARLYLKKFLSNEGDRLRSAFAVSEPFEIPADAAPHLGAPGSPAQRTPLPSARQRIKSPLRPKPTILAAT